MKRLNLIGKKYGRLTVVEFAEDHIDTKGNHRTQFICKCDCGNENPIIVLGSNLKRNNTKSCGCLQKEMASKLNQKYNSFDLKGNYGVGFDCNRKEFYFDKEDYNKIKDYCWVIDVYGYVVSSNNKIRMHRLLLNAPSETQIDHIDGIRHNNKKNNLRLATSQQNAFNAGLKQDNKSGYKGVSWNKNRNKWVSTITKNGKTIYLGLFKDINDAINVRKEAEIEIQGKYARKEEFLLNTFTK